MVTPFTGGTTNHLDDTATEYLDICSLQDSGTTTEAAHESVFPFAGTVRDFHIVLDTAPGTGKSYTFTLRKNGADTSIVITISGSDTTGNSSESVTYAAGDRICLKIVPSGTPTEGDVFCYFVYVGGSKECAVMGSTRTSYTNGGTKYLCGMGCTIPDTTENDNYGVIPTGGTIKNFYVILSNAPGEGESVEVEIRKNEAASGVKITISDANTTGNDILNTVAVSAGDTVGIEIVTSAGTGSGELGFGYQFEPTTDGEAICMYGEDNPPHQTTTEYNMVVGSANLWSGTESGDRSYTHYFKVKNLYVKFNTAPGVDKSRKITLRKNGEDSELAVTISDAATTGNDTSGSTSFIAGDLIGVQNIPTSTPTTSETHFGFVMEYYNGELYYKSGNGNVQIVTEPVTASHKLRIKGLSLIDGIPLVDTDDPNASLIRIYDGSNIKALKKA